MPLPLRRTPLHPVPFPDRARRSGGSAPGIVCKSRADPAVSPAASPASGAEDATTDCAGNAW